VFSVRGEPGAAAADDASDRPGVTGDPAVAGRPSSPPRAAMDSPSRRATRSRIKLAANFSFTAGL